MSTYRYRNEELKQLLQSRFGQSADLSIVPLRIGQGDGWLCYLTTMTNPAFLMDHVVKPLIFAHQQELFTESDDPFSVMRQRLYVGLTTMLENDPLRLPGMLTQGYAGMMLDDREQWLMIDVKQLEKRPISEPTTQTVIKGSKEAFTESAETNISMIRRRILNEHLRFEKYEIGSETKTTVYLCYIEGGADERIVKQIQERLNGSNMNSLFDSESLESIFRPGRGLLFPIVFNTERPDAICTCLLSRRVALIVNGTPFVVVIPARFSDFFQSPEDQYQWYVLGVTTRLLRYLAFMLSLCLPAFYVAITCYHQELVPTLLLTSIAAQREGIPFPAVIEMFMMEIAFELLREASTRMPRIIGQSISIAGALVLGEAAVQAGIVSDITMIIVALTGIAGFVSPIYSFGANIRLFRYALIVLGSILGLYGVIVGCAFLMIHLARIETFGVPYLSLSPRKLGRRSS